MIDTVHETTSQAAMPERYTSDDVYAQVMEQAWDLSPFTANPSPRRAALYEVAGVVPVALERLPFQLSGHQLWESDQTVQPDGSYKLRGSASATEAVLERDPGVTVLHIASAGNAAKGVMRSARNLGRNRGRTLQVIVESTNTISPAKRGPLEAAGAIVHAEHEKFDQAQAAVWRDGALPGHAAIEAFDAIETIAGQATIGWETLDNLFGQAERGEIDPHRTPIKLFVPVGGGGLISGIACVMRWAKDMGFIGDNVQVYGVQMAGCDAMKRYVDCVRAGVTPPDDLFESGLPFNRAADGTAVQNPGLLTREIVADPRFVANIVTVSEGELGIAMADLTKYHGREIEPAGALSLAGARQYMADRPARPVRGMPTETVVTFTTGANVSPELYAHFMEAASALQEDREVAGRAALRAYYDSLDAIPRAAFPPATGKRAGSRVSSSPARPR